VRYLSPEWIEAAGEAIAADDRLGAALAGVTLTVEQVVHEHGVDDGDRAGTGDPVAWHVAIDDGKVSLAAGTAARSDLRFTTDRATATGIASGALSAQRAFVEGRLRVGGDLSLPVAHQRAIAAVDDALAPVRARTTFV
jgi:SCP-2 sterol transfer family